MSDRTPLIRVTAMPSDTPYGGVFGGWKFRGAMAVGDELSVYVDLLKQGRTSLRLKAEAIARERDGEAETIGAEGEFTFVGLDEAGKPREIAAEEKKNG